MSRSSALELSILRMGFANIVLPKKNFAEVAKSHGDKVNLLPAENLRDALKISMPREKS